MTYSKKRKVLFEIKDMLAGIAFPFMISIIFSSTIIAYSAYKVELTVKLLSLLGGEALFIAALIIFGRANGGSAYRKHLLYENKRALNATDESCIYGTGEYRLWKGFFIGFVITIPFIIFLTIELIVPNTFCTFCLQYVFGWGYCPVAAFTDKYNALCYLLVLLPSCVHAFGYYLGKLRGMKVQEALEATNAKGKKRKKK